VTIPVTMLPDERDQHMIDFTVDLWTNFATHHDPTPKDQYWPAYGVSGQTYVRLQDSKIIKQQDPDREKRLQFWQIMLKKSL
jgi:carboxylesterase type B